MAVDPEIIRQKKLIKDILGVVCAPNDSPELPEDIKKCWYLLFEKELGAACCLESLGPVFIDRIDPELVSSIAGIMEEEFNRNTSAWFYYFNEYINEKKDVLKASGAVKGKKIIVGCKDKPLTLDNDLVDTLISVLREGGECGIKTIDITNVTVSADIEKIKSLILAANSKGINISIGESLSKKHVPEFLMEHMEELVSFIDDPENGISCKVKLAHPRTTLVRFSMGYIQEEFESSGVDRETAEDKLITEVEDRAQDKIDEAERKLAKIKVGVASLSSSYGDRLRAHNAKKLKKAASFKLVEPSEAGEVRKGKESLADAGVGDIELSQSQEKEQEQEAEEEQEMMSEREAALDSFERTGDRSELDEYSGEVLSFEGLQSPEIEIQESLIYALRKTAIKPGDGEVVVNYNTNLITTEPDESRQILLAEYILGKTRKSNREVFDHAIHGITKSAFDAIKYHLGHFSGGFDEDNLPYGFSLKVQDGKKIVDFDPSVDGAIEYDPLRIRVEEQNVYEPIHFELVEYGRFSHLEDEERKKLEEFVRRQGSFSEDWLDSVLKIMKVQDEDTFAEMAYISEDGSYHINSEYEELFKDLNAANKSQPNSPPGQIKNILYSYGPVGVKKYADRLIRIKNNMGEEWLNLFIEPLSPDQNDMDFLLNPDSDQTLDAIYALSEKEKKWFFELVKQQQEKTKFSDIKDLFSAYKEFLKEVRDLGVEINDDMPVPKDGNAKVALSRVLYILKNTPAPNRKEQMANVNSNMEVSNVGAWYAKKHDGYYLVTEEMGLKGADSAFGGGFKSRYSSADGSNTRKGFKALMLLGVSDPIDFYRYIGQQLHTAPFDKYRGIYQNVEGLGGISLGPDGKFNLMGLLAIGTTGRKGKYYANEERVEKFLEKYKELYDNDGARLRDVKSKTNWLLQALADANNISEIRDSLTLEHMPSLIKYTIDLSKEGYKQEDVLEFFQDGIENYGSSYIAAIQSIYKSVENNPGLDIEPASFILEVKNKIDISGIDSDLIKKGVLSVISRCNIREISDLSNVDVLIGDLKDLSVDEMELLSKTFMDLDLDGSTELPSIETLKNIIKVCKGADDFSIGRVQSIITDTHPGCTFLSPPPASTKPRVSLEDVLREQVERLGASSEFNPEHYKDIKAFSERLSDMIVTNFKSAILRGPIMSQVTSRIASHFKDCYVRDRDSALEKIKADFADDADKGADRKLKALHHKLGAVLKRYRIPQKDIDGDVEFEVPEGIEDPAAFNSCAKSIHTGLRHGELIMAESEKFAMISGIANRLRRKNINDLSILLGTLLGDEAPLNKIGVVQTANLLEAGMSVLETSSTSRFPNKLIKIILEHPNVANIAQTDSFNNLIDIIKTGFPNSLKEQLLDASLVANSSEVISIEMWQEIANQVPNKVIADFIKMQKECINSGDSINEFKDLVSSISSDYAENEKLQTLIENVLSGYALVEGGIADFNLKLNKLKGLDDLEARYSILEILSKSEHRNIDPSIMSHFAASCISAGDELSERIRKFRQADLHKMDVSLGELEQYIAGQLPLEELVTKHTQGALSQRKQEAKRYQHFDESQIARVIDSLGDLSTDPVEPLSLGARKRIATDMMYINSIGETEALPEIDGVSAKPIIDMTDAEIRAYVKHSKNVISSRDFDEETKRIARLNFLALSREVLCRSTKDDSFAGVFAYTTQIISVLNSMHQGSMHLSEIDTGQGKSHIAALHSAMKWLEGDTVDICTSSMALAAEGLEEHKAFFDAIGARTSLVMAGSSPESYARGGINYSTVSEMALFKARAKIENTLGDIGPTTLILDEADFTTLDDTINYKYAGSIDGKPQGKTSSHAWVYRVINNFIDREEFKDPRFKRADDIANLRSYIEMVCTEEQKRAFELFDDEQLDKWLDSALSAKSLQGYGKYKNPELGDKKADYKVEEVDGQAYARILIHGLPSQEASWSDGVHQFLHDRLNSSGKSEFEFNIAPEADHLASTTAKDLIQSYGTVWGMTGTIGDVEERAEQAAVYGFKMTKVAPHQACRRLDREPEIELEGSIAHKKRIKEAITSRIRSKSGMPAVVVCKDMDKSKEMFDDMLADFMSPENLKKYRKLMPLRVQIFDGAKHEIITLEYKKGKIIEGQRENVENATQAKKNAGEEGTITITTPIMGRGTDFKPKSRKGGAHPHGLLVVQSYVDIVRTSGQIVGRGGRNGQPGESLTIVDGEEMARELGVDLDDSLSVDSDSSILSGSSTISVDSIGEIRDKRGISTRSQRQERQAFGNIQNTAFASVIKILSDLDDLQESIEKKYTAKIKELNKQIRAAGDDTEEVQRLMRGKKELQEEKSRAINALPKRKDILKNWAILLKEFSEETRPHKIREILAKDGQSLTGNEYEDLDMKVKALSRVMVEKWNKVTSEILKKIDPEVDLQHGGGIQASLVDFKVRVSGTSMEEEGFAKRMSEYVSSLKRRRVSSGSAEPVVTSASKYCHRAVAKVEMTASEDITSGMLEEAFREQFLGVIKSLENDKIYKRYIGVSAKKLEKYSGSELIEVYNEFLNKLSRSAESSKQEELKSIVDLKSKLSIPHGWLIDKVKKSPGLIGGENTFIKAAVQLKEYERLAKEIQAIKLMINDLARSIKSDDQVSNDHMRKLSDMLDKLDKARRSMQIYERQVHRFENEGNSTRAARIARLTGAKFDLEEGLVAGHLSKMEGQRKLMIEALKSSGKTDKDIEKFERVHKEMDKVGNRIMLAFHRLGNLISSKLSSIFGIGKRNKEIEPSQTLAEKLSVCQSNLSRGRHSVHEHDYDSSITHAHSRSAPATRLADTIDGIKSRASAPSTKRTPIQESSEISSSPAESRERRNPSRSS